MVKGVFFGVGEGEVWYDWYIKGKVSYGVGFGENVIIGVELGYIFVYVRGGKVVLL